MDKASGTNSSKKERFSSCLALMLASLYQKEEFADVFESCYYIIIFSTNLILEITYFFQIFVKTLSKLQNDIVKRQRTRKNPLLWTTCKNLYSYWWRNTFSIFELLQWWFWVSSNFCGTVKFRSYVDAN